ncbi:hypothetical protein BBJ28_00019232 [Nothophytophthora sp. Chile5]|nr:hypothetical protein BBJ28_00019232 [Nothophytophthora sp. Chile5]
MDATPDYFIQRYALILAECYKSDRENEQHDTRPPDSLSLLRRESMSRTPVRTSGCASTYGERGRIEDQSRSATFGGPAASVTSSNALFPWLRTATEKVSAGVAAAWTAPSACETSWNYMELTCEVSKRFNEEAFSAFVI